MSVTARERRIVLRRCSIAAVVVTATAFAVAASPAVTDETAAAFADDARVVSSIDSVPTVWWAQGNNTSGQYGRGTVDGGGTAAARVLRPVGTATPPGTRMSAISAGEDFACGVAAGRAYCWGDNSSGQLGDGSGVSSAVPIAVATDATASSALPADATVTDISTSVGFACAVADGRVYCWGDNSSGQLGNGTTVSSDEPVVVLPAGSGGSVLPDGLVSKVATGGGGPGSTTGYACAIADARLYCWGSRQNGRLGTGVSGVVPAVVASATVPLWGPAPVTDVALGGSAACAVAGGQVWCWGWPKFGQLGDGDNDPVTDQSVPLQVQVSPASALPATALVTEVAVGATSVCAVHDGEPYCWGTNMAGQLGADVADDTEPTTTVVRRAVKVATVGTGLSQLPTGEASGGLVAGSRDVGPSTYCVLSALPGQHRIPYCWGDNSAGQLGIGSTVDVGVPRAVLQQPASGLPVAADIDFVAAGRGLTILGPSA